MAIVPPVRSLTTQSRTIVDRCDICIELTTWLCSEMYPKNSSSHGIDLKTTSNQMQACRCCQELSKNTKYCSMDGVSVFINVWCQSSEIEVDNGLICIMYMAWGETRTDLANLSTFALWADKGESPATSCFQSI